MKRTTTFILALVLIMMLILPGAAMAQGTKAAASNTAGAAVALRLNIGSSAELQASTLYRMVNSANARIQLLVKIAQITPWNDVALLLYRIDQITGEVFAYANRIGAVVVCDYVEYKIDGQSVMIDPLRVVRVPAPVED